MGSGRLVAPPRRKLGALVKITVVLPVFGALIATACMPFALAFAGTADKAITAWDEMPHELGNVVAKQRTVLLDKDGHQWGQLFSENRVNIGLDQMSVHVKNALLDTEDSRFYQHGGLDAKGTARAFVNNAQGGNRQGASTISQQLVENLRIVSATTQKQRDSAKADSLKGKVQELRYAVALEAKYSKDELLQMYLNTVYLGNGAYGISAAAQRYFSTTADKLNVDQSATLVAMLKSPTLFDPVTHPNESFVRRNVVMKRMVSQGHFSQSVYTKIRTRPTRLHPSKPKSGCASSKYPYYCALLLTHILSSPEFGASRADRERFLSTGGLIIRTALNPRIMKAAQQSVDVALGRDNRVAAGVAIMQPGTGRLIGIAQNRTWGTAKKGTFAKTEIVYPASAQFQPGSTFKPITLATALEQGISEKTRYDTASPMTVAGIDSPPGGFKNDDSRGHGVLDAYGAAKNSVNTWFVQLVRDAGVKNTADMARRLGMYSVPDDLNGHEGAITLGAYETSPIQMATVYATFAARGVECDPVLIISAKDVATGKNVNVPDGNCHQAVMPVVADTVADVLRAPFTPGGTASKLNLDGGRKSGGKTGTTNNNAATWFAGFTPQAATAVWVGDPRGGNRYPLAGTYAYGQYFSVVWGGTIAGPIWKQTMNAVHHGLEKRWLPSPKGASSSLKSRIVPTITGMKLDEAVTLLLDQGFQVAVAEKQAKNKHLPEAGFVAAQSPKAGGKTGWGTKVTIYATAGSPTHITLPALKKNQTSASAKHNASTTRKKN